VKAMNNTINQITNTFKMQIILIELKEYKDIFLTKSINKLFLYKEHDHAIEITAQLLYNLLYNLLNMKLATLGQYLNDVLAKE